MLSKMDEKRHVKAMREGLFRAFPNPERKDCPGPDVMRAIAAGKMGSADEDKWIDHFALCSPCSKEFFEIRRSYIRNKRVRATGIASVVVLCAALGIWGWVRHQQTVKSTNTIVHVTPVASFREQIIDLRNWSGERTDSGTESMQKTPLELHRWRTSLVIYLPSGSEPGKYEIEILEGGKPVLNMDGVAHIEGGNTVVRLRADLNSLKAGRYTLGVRQPPWDWRFLLVTLE